MEIILAREALKTKNIGWDKIKSKNKLIYAEEQMSNFDQIFP